MCRLHGIGRLVPAKAPRLPHLRRKARQGGHDAVPVDDHGLAFLGWRQPQPGDHVLAPQVPGVPAVAEQVVRGDLERPAQQIVDLTLECHRVVLRGRHRLDGE